MDRDYYKAVNTLEAGLMHSAAEPYAAVRYIPETGQITYCRSRHTTLAAAKQAATKANCKEERRVA
jgi:hypothetical protein